MKKLRNNPPQIPTGNGLIDTHCHLDMRGYEDLDNIIQSAAQVGVDRIISVGIDVRSSKKAVEIACRFPNVYATIGVHPHSAAHVDNKTYDTLKSLFTANREKIVAYGEIGLDYAKEYAPRDIQRKQFSKQLSLAKDLNLPIIIHDRDAHEDTMQILHTHKPYPAGGVMHCFSGDSELAKQVIDLGFYISIPGIVTFNKSDIMQQVVIDTNLEHIILETDGPFLAPVPYRGKTNKPEYLVYTAQKIAELKNLSLEHVAQTTTANSENLFHLNSKSTIQ